MNIKHQQTTTPLLRLTCTLGIAVLASGCASEGLQSEADFVSLEEYKALELPASSAEEDGVVDKSWTITPEFEGVGSGLMLGVQGASKKSGANAVMWKGNGSADQSWQIFTQATTFGTLKTATVESI